MRFGGSAGNEALNRSSLPKRFESRYLGCYFSTDVTRVLSFSRRGLLRKHRILIH